MRNHLRECCLDVDGGLLEMTPEELDEHLSSDIFIGVGSAAGDIPENKLVEAVKAFVASRQQMKWSTCAS